MALVSNSFILFVFLCVLVYYIVPKKTQWVVLLVCSYFYYYTSSHKATLFLAASTCITYLSTCWMDRIQKRESGKKAQSAMKRVMLLGMLGNLGILAVLKYTNFIIENINAISKGQIELMHFLLPLGISYYTFQSVGYVLDVYWGKVAAERNPLKLALFVSFFPQLLQGPIGRYERLAHQLYAQHSFESRNIKYGLERILWGFFKKMIIADWAAVFADAIFAQPDTYAGIAGFGVLLYSAELYGNFSGGIDIIIGVANLFGITMDENFTRPFFASSITDFWHRWHITLGTWMKDYVFYPLSLSKFMRKVGKNAKKVLGKKYARALPICISNLVVFFIVGVWHGPTWSNIGWGMYNGIIIAFSDLFGHVYVKMKKKLHIDDQKKWYRGFMILRTFILVNISWYFECVPTFGQAMQMMKYSVTQFHPSQFLEISSGKLGVEFTPYALTILGMAVLILFVVSVLQEKGIRMRDTLSKTHIAVQVLVCLILLVCIPLFAPMSAARGFIYAQF